VVALFQHKTDLTKEKFEANYRVSPKLVQAVPMLIENAVAVDRFNQQMAQRKRQIKNKEKQNKRQRRNSFP